MIISLLSGILLALCFPKFNLIFLAWIGLIPFLYTLKKSSSNKDAIIKGYIFGITFFAVNLFWLYTLTDYAGSWAILGYLALVLFQASYLALAAFIIKNAYKRIPSLTIIAVPLIWIFIEWLRTQTPFGVAAGGLGYSQTSFLPLLQIASIGSVYGISFLIVLTNILSLIHI